MAPRLCRKQAHINQAHGVEGQQGSQRGRQGAWLPPIHLLNDARKGPFGERRAALLPFGSAI